jgi:hypothetical protein
VRPPSPVPAVVAGLVLALALGGCGGDHEPADERARLVADLAGELQAETDGALDEDAATCVATHLVETVGEDRFDEVVAVADGEGDQHLRDQVIDVFAGCDALEPIIAEP